jgi:hypothetical protein
VRRDKHLPLRFVGVGTQGNTSAGIATGAAMALTATGPDTGDSGKTLRRIAEGELANQSFGGLTSAIYFIYWHMSYPKASEIDIQRQKKCY